ncbi:carboxylic ester hydrolase [Actinoplanes ianthinogenes]|uniref:Carboxylic ester hydrolase n=1 Tax=Actinoplanes ianthinogenes TaxID=122358 RepID=A0ABM7LJL9_9ACTN|nr:carboxylic ester hydrolase [Actinoplanes ianthinogenes]GGR36030.1 carboxylic ester hydrolase [Actinoplanes ianthinogenes]
MLTVFMATVLLAAPGVPAAGPGGAVVRTDAGRVRGVDHDGYRTFEGIPYAAPPTGDRRWRAPQPVAPWPGVRPASAPGPDCAQLPDSSSAEDCLYLTVTAPRDGRTRRPVIVWLHGGGFQTGSGSMYDAHRLVVRGGVVVVTVNYRLGVLGYLGLPGLAGSGTFGLQDQQAALRWVRRNAAAFGGDPGSVTLAGQSAGGMSVCAQLTSPGAAGLFHRAIIQSGSCLVDWPSGLFHPKVGAGSAWSPVDAVRAAGSGLAATFGCGADAVGCLRRQPVTALLEATRGTGVRAFVTPAYGTAVLPEHPATALRRGAFARVPVLSGGTLDEHRGFLAGIDLASPVTAEQYAAVLTTAFGARAGRVAATYPVASYPTPALAWAAVATDRIWACPGLAGDRLLARRTATYAYEFAERHGPAPSSGYPWGAFHGAELAFLFDTWWLAGTPQPALADRMIDSWARFAATGRTDWSAFPAVRTLASGTDGYVDLDSEHHCRFWASIG